MHSGTDKVPSEKLSGKLFNPEVLENRHSLSNWLTAEFIALQNCHYLSQSTVTPYVKSKKNKVDHLDKMAFFSPIIFLYIFCSMKKSYNSTIHEIYLYTKYLD